MPHKFEIVQTPPITKANNTLELIFSFALKPDAEQLVTLINSAYRGESSRQGWTFEADLLDGRRTDVQDILVLLANQDSRLIICKAEDVLLGSVHIQKNGVEVQIGMLAVSPILQGRGIGKRLLQEAEAEAERIWGCSRFEMSVISCRQELIAFYERCGYRRTGISKAFPDNPGVWQPKVEGLRLEILEKRL